MDSFKLIVSICLYPQTLKPFVTNLLYGPSERVQDDAKEQASLSIAQLIHFRTRLQFSVLTAGTQHHKEREPPRPLYLGLEGSHYVEK